MLVGETGVGKTSLLSLISNILQGHSPSEYETVYDPANESGLSGKHSQTMSAKVYKFVSKNGITIHILDTPGLADTRGLAKDEEHKANIAKTIQAHMPFVNAVLILANGTLPRLGVATDYTLSVLSSIFPRSLASNIAFMFTNVSTPLAWNFDKNSLPKVLAEAPQYSLDNPVAMQQRLLQIKKEGKADAKILRRLTTSVATSHNDALDAFVDFFNWAADCKPQPTNEIVSLCQKSEAIEMRLHEAMSKILRRSELKKRLTRMISDLENKTLNLNALRNYESVVAQSIMVTQKTSDYNTLCVHPQCHSNCHESCNLNFHLNPKALLKCTVFDDGKKTTCNKCGHSYRDHRHFYYIWEEHKEEVKAVDEEAKAKFKEALLDRCGGEWMRTWHSKQIKRLDSELADATNEIRTQAQAYASLSLSGSFSAQLYKAIKVLEMNLENIKGKETDPDTIQGIEDSIAQLKEKLRILQSDAE
ncbi:hypothetical protein SISSUDRAFT_992946 [Sistotremastrum suecicum HHB10207 ss-3]|uniref:Uncharacterized protein n=1 Tax=Sistotremastrum suecicum HHB10207 ss-3 TaxID=1314776 RepID=A0A165YR53_9AGAM|nr:hypothetical protein SISSUDRAFT_992946 [Sistotremastrum suecicum HHB10207 ss-3]